MENKIEHLILSLDVTDVLTVQQDHAVLLRATGCVEGSDEFTECVAAISTADYLAAIGEFLDWKRRYNKAWPGEFCGAESVWAEEWENAGECTLRSTRITEENEEGFDLGKLIPVRVYRVTKIGVEMEHG